MDTSSLLYGEGILYSKECNWYTRCCPLNGGVRYRECPLREAIQLHPLQHNIRYSLTSRVLVDPVIDSVSNCIQINITDIRHAHQLMTYQCYHDNHKQRPHILLIESGRNDNK